MSTEPESFAVWRRPYMGWLRSHKDGMFLVERVPKDWKSYDFKFFSEKEINASPISVTRAISIQLSNMAKALESITVEKLSDYVALDYGISKLPNLLEEMDNDAEEEVPSEETLEERMNVLAKKANRAIARGNLLLVIASLKKSRLAQVCHSAISDWLPIISQSCGLTSEIRLLAENVLFQDKKEIYNIVIKALGHLERLSTFGREFCDCVSEHSELLSEEEEQEDVSEQLYYHANAPIYLLLAKDIYDFAQHISDTGIRFKLEELAFELQAYCRTKHVTHSEALRKREGETGKNDANSLTKAERVAYQSCECAISQNQNLAEAKDDDVYSWLKENGTREEYELPSCETWKRQVRAGRKHHGTQKNAPRAGRTSRSVVPVNQIEYTSSQKAD